MSFIDQAKAEAERRFPDGAGSYPTNVIPEYQREAFLGCAEWAVEQEPTETADGALVVSIPVCHWCINAEGEECHTPECSFYLMPVPEVGSLGQSALLAAREARKA